MSILALAGGVGGAKLAEGLAATLPPGELTVAVNVGDDFEHLGLHISPDIDTVTYTLAGLNNQEQGWGLAGETWNFITALERLGGDAWFRLGDKDIATHIERTRRLKTESLSAVTADFAKRLGIAQHIVPVSDDPVRTMVRTDRGLLAFQDYFVRLRCAPRVERLEFPGIESMKPSAGFAAALADPALTAIIVCPSNPFLSILPILSIPGVRDALERRTVPLIAVSPIIGGQAVKGPAAKIMEELNIPVSSLGVAAFYDRLLDGLMIDAVDAALSSDIKEASDTGGPAILVGDTMMRNSDDRRRVAAEVLAFAERLSAMSLSA
jgi:LPPG:FO 2-phospho-L-lactate transferase